MASKKLLVDLEVSGDITANNLSGTNTGDQNLSGYLLNTTDTLTGTLTMASAAVPFIFEETGYTGEGKYWRHVQDSGGLRFDSCTAGDGLFTPYVAGLQLSKSGAVKFGGLATAGFMKTDAAGNVSIDTTTYSTTDTTYVSSDFTHDDLTGFVANEHIDWTTDQGATNIHSGNYTNTVYSLPEATATVRGGIELFSNTDQAIAATAVSAVASRTYGIQLNTAGQAVVNVPWSDTNTQNTYVSSDFTHDDLTGFVSNEHIDWTTDQGATNIHSNNYTDTNTFRPIDDTPVDAATTTSISSNWAFDNVKTAVPSGALFTDTNTTYVSSDFTHDDLTGFVANEHIDWTTDQGATNINANNYTNTVYSLPLATSTVRGGIELFSNTDQTVAANAVTTAASRTYGIQLNTANQAVVNVPWVDTNTTYTNISEFTNDSGYTTNAGTVTEVSGTGGLTGSGIGTVQISVDYSGAGNIIDSAGDGATIAVTDKILYEAGGSTVNEIAVSSLLDLKTTITGNAATATALQTARTIAGVSFNGTANISLNNNAITNGAGYLTASSTQSKYLRSDANDRTTGNLAVGSIDATSGIGSSRILKVSSTGNSEVNVDHSDGGTGSDIGLFSFSRNGDHLAHMKGAHDGSTSSAFLSFHTQTSGGSYANAAANERMRITSTGSVGIGTTSPNLKLDIVSGLNNGVRISATDTTSNWRDISIRSYVSEAEANALGDTGTYIYTSSPSGTTTDTPFGFFGATVIQGRDNGNGGLAVRLGNGTGLATRMWIGATGVTVFSNTVTATNFILSSDERLKENIEEFENKHIDVDWKTFEMKSDKGQKRYGVIAQELEEVHPEFVRTDEKGMKSVAYIDLLIAKNAELEARLEKLERLLLDK